MSRIKKLCKSLQQASRGCVIENPIDILYFTGLKVSVGKLCVHPEDATLFVDGRYLQMAQEKATIAVQKDEREALSHFFRASACREVCLDGSYTCYDAFIRWQETLRGMHIISDSAFFKPLRVIKDKDEIDRMKKSADMLWRGYRYILSELKEGITEKEVCRRFEIFCLQEGAQELGFSPIIAFGPHSAMPHYTPQEAPLKAGDIVLIDIGVVVDHYHSDMTRVIFYKKADVGLEKLYTINKEAQKNALKMCRPNVTVKELDLAAREVMKRHGVEHLFIHGLGHGIGLQIHEFPSIRSEGPDKDLLLQSGMVFTVEPGLYMPNQGGVRYEDTIVITDTGYENFYPDEELLII